MSLQISNSDNATRVDIVAYRGDTFSRAFTFTNQDGSQTDLTGFSFQFNIGSSVDNFPVLTYLSTDENSVINIAANVVTILIAASVMAQIAGENYIYDFRMIGTTVSTVMRGRFNLIPSAIYV